MTMANFPKGFSGGVSLQGFPISMILATSQASLGNTAKTGVYWVDSVNGLDGNNGSYQLPLATLGRALALASPYDIIVLKPGHAETIINATAASTLWNVANVSIIGLGQGVRRPTFTFTTANTATITVSVGGVSVQNVLFVGNFLSIATVFTVTTGKDFYVDGNEFRDTSSVLGFLSIVTTNSTANAADGVVFNNNRVFSASTSAGAAVVLAGTTNRCIISQNFINHTGATNNVSALLEHGALVVDNLEVSRNIVQSVNTDTATGALLVKTTAITGSGMIFDNYAYHLDVAAAILVTAAAVQYGLMNNLATGDTGTSGYVLPAIGTN